MMFEYEVTIVMPSIENAAGGPGPYFLKIYGDN